MPYASDKQRAYLHINEPELAKEWDMKYPSRGNRTNTNRQKQQAAEIRKRPSKKKSSASNQGGASVGGGT